LGSFLSAKTTNSSNSFLANFMIIKFGVFSSEFGGLGFETPNSELRTPNSVYFCSSGTIFSK
jgi:hypothetical protein